MLAPLSPHIRFSLLALGVCTFSAPSVADQDTSVEEVNVTAKLYKNRAQNSVTLPAPRSLNMNLVPLLKTDPSLGFRVNSRGELVFRLRGSEERQTQLFLDGAPIAVPWDMRADAGFIPSALVTGVIISKSAAPIEYGQGAVLGAVNLLGPLGLRKGRLSAKGSAMMGTGGAFQAAQDMAIPLQKGVFYTAIDFDRRDHLRGPDGPIPNTDQRQIRLYSGLGIDLDQGQAQISLLYSDGQRGIAAENHLDPAVDPVRYWRYPDRRYLLASGALTKAFDGNKSLDMTLWYQGFQQKINSFERDAYTNLAASQLDDDSTLGGRFVMRFQQQNWGLRLITAGQSTRHDRREQTGLAAVKERFRQKTATLASEIDFALGQRMKLSLSGGLDVMTTPETGGRPKLKDQSAFTGGAELEWALGSDRVLWVSLGQRTRFPTLRELYGTALGRFVLNADLQPETALLLDVKLALAGGLTLSPWVSRLSDSIGQDTVTVAGQPFRQRVNLATVTGYGFDAAWVRDITDNLSIEAKIALQGFSSDSALLQRPTLQSSLRAAYTPNPRWSFETVWQVTAGAKDQALTGEIITLPTAHRLDLSATYQLTKSDQAPLMLKAQLTNATNSLSLPQLGLPDPGRTFMLSLSYQY